MHILLVEDDPIDALEMSHRLRHLAAAVDVAGTGAAAIALASGRRHDLVLLDPALPDMEGAELLRRLRAAQIDTPVMMLPGRGGPAEKIQALRIDAESAGPAALTAGALVLNPRDRVATVKGRPLRLTGKECDVLALLMRRKGAVLTKPAFLDHLYGGDGPAMKIIDVFICRLRRKLDQAGAGVLIGTIRGQGYVLRDLSPSSAARQPAMARPTLAA